MNDASSSLASWGRLMKARVFASSLLAFLLLPALTIVMATTASAPTMSEVTIPSEGPLFLQYPVNSVLELTLAPNAEVVRGLVYCTDDVSNSVVLKKSLTHTTLASEIRIINATSITNKKVIQAEAPTTAEEGEAAEELALPLPNVSKKALEEREKRAIRLAEESFRHINEKATPEGQAVFDRLLKACNDVEWRGESILVLSQIQVDPPYGTNECSLMPSHTGPKHEASLERVKKIVSAAPVQAS